MRCAARLLLLLLSALVLLLADAAVAAAGADATTGAASSVPGPAAVVVVKIDGAIGPATADHVHRGLAFAARERARLVVLRIDTPGGLDLSMRAIIRDILASPVAVATYVAPDGARAASAGTYILYASHVAAMAPASNLGAATPVAIGLPLPGGRGDDEGEGAPPTRRKASSSPTAPSRAPAGASGAGAERPADAMAAKRLADASAYIRSLAQLRGRNAEWAEQAVRESVSLSSAEALKAHVIDFVARDLPDLLRQADGRRVELPGGSVVLATRDASLVAFEPDWRNRVLATITDPGMAMLLMMIGMLGLLAEFSTPGLVLPGVVGAISLLVALFALQMLPVSMAGLGLLLLGVALLVAEAFVPSFGSLGLGGLAAFVLGALFLIDTDAPGFGVPRPLIGLLAVPMAAFVFGIAVLAARTRRRPSVAGNAALLGTRGEVIEFDPRHGEGWASVEGVPWKVRAAEVLAAGTRVRVTGVDGLVLRVEAEAGTGGARAGQEAEAGMGTGTGAGTVAAGARSPQAAATQATAATEGER